MEALIDIINPELYADPAELLAKGTVDSMIEQNEGLRERFYAIKSRTSGNTLLNKKFVGGSYRLKGANTPTSFSQYTAPFRINENKLYSVKELADLLRLRRQFFREASEHTRIMKGLSEFSAKTELEFRDADDRKGNAEQLKKRVSNIELDLEFTLKIPIFKNFEVNTFRVEILADVTDGGVKLWLESVELAELLYKERDRIFNEQIAALADYVIIEQ